MKVLIVQGGLNTDLVSGEEVVIQNDIERLSRLNQVKYLNVRIPNSGITKFISRLSGITWSFKCYRLVKKEIETFKPDVIHFHTTIPYTSLSVLVPALKSKIKIFFTLHNSRWICMDGAFFRQGFYCTKCVNGNSINGLIFSCGRGGLIGSFLLILNMKLFRLIVKKLKKRIRLIAVSKFVRDVHISAGFDNSLIYIRNNGVKLEKKITKHSYEDRNGIVYAGRISVAKGSSVIKAIIQSVDYPFYIIGNGPELESLKKYCSDNSLSHVYFRGNLNNSDTISVVRKCRVCVIPSQCGDSYPTTAIEALSVGTPVVASNLGGLTDLIKGSQAGKLVEPQNQHGFVAAINNIYESKKIHDEMSSNAYKYSIENCDIDKLSSKLDEIYNL